MKKGMVMYALGLSLVLGGCGGAGAGTGVGETAAAVEAGADAARGEENQAADGSKAAGEGGGTAETGTEGENTENDAGGETTETGTEGENAEAGTETGKDVKTADAGAAENVENVQDGKDDGEKAETGNQETAKDAGEKEENVKTADGGQEKEMDADGAETGTGEQEDGKKEPQLKDYEITVFGETQVMYAASPVNVRSGPSTDFARTGGLDRGQEVSVTGQADTGWYEIAYGDGKAYVSGHYLQKEKPAEEAPVPEVPVQEGQTPEPEKVQAVTEVKNVAGVILVGDSRFVQMQENVGENSCTWIAENGKGYNWFNETAVARIDGCVGKGSKILINLGVNDPGHVNDYVALVNAKAAEWTGKGATVYYASVNPVWDNPYTTEEQVIYFNSQMQAGLSGDVHWIDSHGYLDSIGYKLVDGLHFNAETYQNLYAYFMSCL